MATILVKSRSSPENVAYERMFNRYGTNCSLKHVVDSGDFWTGEFDIHVPVEIRDERRDRVKIFSIRVENLGKIRISKETMEVIEAPTLLSVEKTIHDHRVRLRKAVERDLMKIAHLEFSKIDAAKISLSPILTTLTNMLQEKRLGQEGIRRSGYMPQIRLLEEMGYVRWADFQLVPSDKLVQLRQQSDSDETAINKVLGLVLAEKFDFLVEELKITQLLPFVRLSATYYSEAVTFGDLISVSEDSLLDRYLEYYRTASDKRLLRYAPIISELVDVSILRYDGPLVTGEEPIFRQLSEDLAGQVPRSREPHELA